MKPARIFVFLAALSIAWSAAGAQINWQRSGTNALLQFEGDANDDWRLQVSADLTNWITQTNFGLLLSGKATNAPWRSAGGSTNAHQFYRGLKTSGLFDPTEFHTINLKTCLVGRR